jgi:hypothetical protein
MVAALLFGQPAFGQSFDGRYRATLNCEKLPFTKAPLTNEPVALTIAGGKVSYSRTFYGYDRNTIVGKETGSGSVAADGTIVLSGGWTGRRNSLKASYRGKLSGGGATLDGKHILTHQGQTYDRACSMTIAK